MTLTELYTARIETLERTRDSLKSELDSLRTSKRGLEQDVQFWTNRIAAREAELEKAESDIATTSTVAEIEAIASSMRKTRIDRRASQAKLALSQKSLSVSGFKLDGLVKMLDDVGSELSGLKSDLDEVIEVDEKHQTWIDSVALDPLASIPSEADVLLTGAITSALNKLKSITSNAFVDMLNERLEHHRDELSDLETRIDELNLINETKLALQSGREAEVEAKLRAFDTAVQGLSEFVANSQTTLESAEAIASRVQQSELLNDVQKAHFDSLMAEGDIAADVLNPESELRVAEHKLLIRIRELETARAIARAADPSITDSDLDDVAEVKAILDGSDGKAPIATMQTDYDDAINAIGVTTFDVLIEKESALKNAERDLAVAIAEFLEENPDQDPNTATELDDARDAVSDAKAELDTATDTMRDSPWYKLEQLEVAVPPATWIDALYLLQAQRKLNSLKTIDPTSLANAVTSAANDLATVLETQIETEDGISIAQTLIDQYQDKVKKTTVKGTEAALNVALGVL